MIACTVYRLTLECDEDGGLDFHCPASLLLDADNQVLHVYCIARNICVEKISPFSPPALMGKIFIPQFFYPVLMIA